MVQWISPFRRGESRAALPFQNDVNRLFEAFFPDAAAGAFESSLDVVETKDAWLVRLELPGVDPKDVAITLTQNELVIRGESKRAEETADAKSFHRERRFGAFERTLTLPTEVAGDRVSASSRHGVLEIVLPKRPEAQPRTIAVDAAK